MRGWSEGSIGGVEGAADNAFVSFWTAMMAAARKWPFARSVDSGVEGDGCLDEVRNAVGTVRAERGW